MGAAGWPDVGTKHSFIGRLSVCGGGAGSGDMAGGGTVLTSGPCGLWGWGQGSIRSDIWKHHGAGEGPRAGWRWGKPWGQGWCEPRSEANAAGPLLTRARLLPSLGTAQGDGVGPGAVLPLLGHFCEDL